MTETRIRILDSSEIYQQTKQKQLDSLTGEMKFPPEFIADFNQTYDQFFKQEQAGSSTSETKEVDTNQIHTIVTALLAKRLGDSLLGRPWIHEDTNRHFEIKQNFELGIKLLNLTLTFGGWPNEIDVPDAARSLYLIFAGLNPTFKDKKDSKKAQFYFKKLIELTKTHPVYGFECLHTAIQRTKKQMHSQENKQTPEDTAFLKESLQLEELVNTRVKDNLAKNKVFWSKPENQARLMRLFLNGNEELELSTEWDWTCGLSKLGIGSYLKQLFWSRPAQTEEPVQLDNLKQRSSLPTYGST